MTTGIPAARANAILNANRTGGSSLTAVTTAYAQLHTADPGANGTTAVSVGNATRQQINHNAASAGSMTISNTPTWTNGGTSETITHISVWDASSSGNLLYTASVGSNPWISGQAANLTGCTVSITPLTA